MNQEFENIFHDKINYKIFLVTVIYRTPHIHKDFEFGLVLEGEITIHSQGKFSTFSKGDFFVMNPFQSHEIKSINKALVLSLQVSHTFFSSWYPQIEQLDFLSFNFDMDCKKNLSNNMIKLAYEYFKSDDLYEFRCAILLNEIFLSIMNNSSYKFITEKERLTSKIKGERMRQITNYIDTHYCEKLLLSEIAKVYDLSLSYLSHFFKDCFEMTFQDYLLKIRAEKARHLLLSTELSLLDICFTCGFSDPKYFNSGFKRLYGYTPKNYRKQFYNKEMASLTESMLTTEKFLSPSSSLVVLSEYL